jgi:integrase
LDAYLADRQLIASPASVATYRALLKELPRDLPVSAFTATLARDILTARVQRGGKLSSVETQHGVLSGFAAWLVQRGYLLSSPMRDVPCPRSAPPPHRFLTADELRRLWDATGQTRKPDETRLILLLLLEGLRASELCGLRWQDIREDRIVLVATKGGQPRAVPLTPAIRVALDGQPRGVRVFGFNRRGLGDRLSRLGRFAGVPHVHPHLLRHTWASLSLLAGASPENVRVLGGWRPNSDVFERYVASVREDAAIKSAVDLGELFRD